MNRKIFLRILMLFVIASAMYADPQHIHDWDPKGYVLNSNSQVEDGEAVLQRILRDYNYCFSGLILDLGCRDGRITCDLAEYFKNATVIGIEKSQTMIDHAIAYNGSLPNLKFKRENLEHFQLTTPADLVVSIFTLNWVSDLDQVFLDLHNNMAKNGKFYALLSATKENLPFHQALNIVMNKYAEDFKNFVNSQYFYDTEAIRSKLVNSGFYVLTLCYKHNAKTYHTEASLKNWIAQWLPQVKYLPQQRKEMFMNDLIKEYLKQSHQEGSHSIQWNEYVISLEAIKA